MPSCAVPPAVTAVPCPSRLTTPTGGFVLLVAFTPIDSGLAPTLILLRGHGQVYYNPQWFALRGYLARNYATLACNAQRFFSGYSYREYYTPDYHGYHSAYATDYTFARFTMQRRTVPTYATVGFG